MLLQFGLMKRKNKLLKESKPGRISQSNMSNPVIRKEGISEKKLRIKRSSP